MIYRLSETDKMQLRKLKEQIFDQYNEEDALIIDDIITRSLQNEYLDKTDVNKLIEVLPKSILSSKEIVHVYYENKDIDWNKYYDDQRATCKREIEQFYRMLISWIFMQNAIDSKSRESVERAHKVGQTNNSGHVIGR